MPVRYDPLLTAALGAEIRDRWMGRRAVAFRAERDRRRGALEFEEGPAIAFLLHPEAGHLVAAPTAPPGDPERFRNLRLTGVTAPPDERLLYLDLGSRPGEPRFRVVAELHTNQWNLLLLRMPGHEIRRVLWPREPGERRLRQGARYEPPAGGRRGAEGGLSRDEWEEVLAGRAAGERRGAVLREIAHLSSVNVEWVLEPAERGDPDEAYRRYRRVARLSAGAAAADEGKEEEQDESFREAWLLPRRWGLQPYPLSLGEERARQADGLLPGMERAAREGGAWERLREEGVAAGQAEERPAELRELEEALRKRREQLDERRGALVRELEEGPDPEELRERGNLLLARLQEVPAGRETVRLEGFDGEPVEVDLDPALAPSENAQRYFEQAGRRDRAASRIPKEIRRTDRLQEEVERALERVREADSTEALGSEAVDRMWELAGGRPVPEEDEEGRRRPYRVLETRGGLEVRVGVSAKANEELTFHHSHTEDVWLHARQVPGSHVILRWGRRDQNPPRPDLLEAANAAAVNSQARHSTTVAVDWTRRKYVRSPRKSAPGVVIPGHVDTVFVRPDPDGVKRMARRARRPSTPERPAEGEEEEG